MLSIEDIFCARMTTQLGIFLKEVNLIAKGGKGKARGKSGCTTANDGDLER